MEQALYLCVADGGSVARLRLGDDLDGAGSPTLDRIRAVVGEGLASLDDGAIEQLVSAFDLPHDGAARLASPVEVWQFLRCHEGAAVFLAGVANRPAVASSDVRPSRSRSDGRPWETAAGVAAWREQQAGSRVDPDADVAQAQQSRQLPGFVAWGTAAAIATLVVAVHLLTVDVPGLAFAFGAR